MTGRATAPTRCYYSAEGTKVVEMAADPDFATKCVDIEIDGLIYRPADEFAVARDPERGAIIVMLRGDQGFVIHATSTLLRDLSSEFARLAEAIDGEAGAAAAAALDRARYRP